LYILEDIVTDLLGPGRGHSVNRMWRCPLHDDRTASLSVNMETGLWHCFGCGRKGALKTLFREMGETLDGDIGLRLAQRQAESAGDYTPPPLLNEQSNRARRSRTGSVRFQERWRAFTDERGIDPSTQEEYQIGWSEETGALTFPYFDADGNCIGMKYRDQRGHKWSEPESRFGFFGPSAIGMGIVVICEGESDTLRCASEFYPTDGSVSVVGTSGASLQESHWEALAIQLLFSKRVFLVYDADDAGDRCADAAMRVLGDKAVRIRPTCGKDLTEHLLNGGTLDEIGLGEDALHV
jgi:DNA primase